MKVRSKGLGRIELIFNFNEVSVKNERGELVLTGRTVRPVIWDFRIAVESAEIPALLKIILRRCTIAFFFRYLWRALTFKPQPVVEEEEELGQTVFVKVVDQDDNPLTIPIFIEGKPYRDGDTPIFEVQSVKLMSRSEIVNGKFLRWETDGGVSVEQPESTSTSLKIKSFGTLKARYAMQRK